MDEQIVNDLTISVGAGVITAFVLWLVAAVYRKIVLPSLRTAMYRGARIDGSWNGYDDHDLSMHVSDAEIRQRGNYVEIKIERSIRRTNHAEKKARTLRYVGEFINGTLVATYYDVRMPDMIRGAMVLTLDPDGKMREGCVVYFDRRQQKVIAPAYVLVRKQ
jgi:hypothetical protein